MCQLYYSFFNAFSVQTLFSSIFLTFYNITFTSMPIFLFGLFEQRYEIKKIEKNPYLYRLITRNKFLSASEFCKWSFLGLWHSLCAYFFAYGLYAYSSHFSNNGTLSGYAEFGSLIIMIVFLNVHVKLLLEWHYQTIAVLISYACSIIAFIVFCLIPNSFIMPSFLTSITDNQTFYWIFYDLFSHAATWLCILLAVVASNLPDLITSIFETMRERFITVKYESRELNTIEQNSFETIKKNKVENFSITNNVYSSEKDKGIEIPIDKSRVSAFY
jgi:phospholipid-translocating ATPase